MAAEENTPDPAQMRQPPPTDPHPLLTRFAWIPLVVLAAVTLVLVPLNPDWAFNSPLLFAGLNLLFGSAVPFAVAVLAGRAFLAGGSWAALLLGAGMLAFGLGSGLAGTLVSFYGMNLNVTTHNVGAFLAGVCHLTGALLSTARHAEARRPRSPGAVLVSSYLVVGLAMGLVTLGVIDGLLPPFFLPGTGNTLLRNVVLGAAVAQLAVSALLLRIGFAETHPAFCRWYAAGLGLVAIGLLAAFFVVRSGTPISWVGRTAQYLGAVYILFAVLTVLRDYYAHGLSVGRALAAFFGETRAPYRPLVDSATDALISLDAHGTVLFWNTAAQRLFGAPLAEVFGRDLAECIVPPEAAGDFRRDFHTLPRTPDGLVAGTRIERELLARSGRAFPAEIAFLGRNTPQGSVTIAVIRDITERKQAEMALRRLNEELEARVRERTAALEAAHAEQREQRDRLAALINSIQDEVWFADPKGHFTLMNPEARRAFGIAAEEVIDVEHLAASLEVLRPDGSPRPVDEAPPLRALRGEVVRNQEELIRTPATGEVRARQVNAAPVHDAAGLILGSVSVVRDITALKQAQEERARLLAEVEKRAAELEATIASMAIGLIIYDTAGRAILLNKHAQAVFSPEIFLKMTVEERRHVIRWESEAGQPLSLDDIPVARALRGETAHNVVIAAPFPDHTLWISASAAPIRTPDGKMLGAVATFVDITARKRAEEALRQAHDTLEQRVAARTAELSRTLQQLSVQSAQLRSLASELTLAEQRERLRLAEQIHDGLQQLLVAARFRVTQVGRGDASTVRQDCEAIGQLLDEAVADSRSLTAELSPPILRTGGLLAGLEWLARWSQEKHHLTVHVQAPVAALPPLPEDLTVLLFQSVRELLFNAVKYAQVPEATVTLAWDPSGLTLTVADTGAGFHPGGLRGEGGVAGGFGLARIRHRLELLGGCMTVDSAPGQGTRVTLAVLLPTAGQPTASPLAPEVMAAPQPALARDNGSPRAIRILLADDHQVVRRALAQLLGVEADLVVVGEAGTGTAAVALARQLVPDVILMDINMPEMNGIDATRAIHAVFPAMRVIGLSMFDHGDQQAAMHDAGAVAYVSKSGPTEALLSAIRAGR